MKKDVFQIVLLVVMFIFVGYRMYTKYFRKSGESTSQDSKERSKIPSSARDDDYEPYQKK
jgi:hypothetical protein